MRPATLGDRTLVRASALILGPSCVGRAIAAQLSDLGYLPVLESELPGRLPAPSEPEAVPRLRTGLAQFIGMVGAPRSSYAHCVHPGTSAWADRPELGQIAQELGLSAIAPSVRVVSLFSNRLSFLTEAEQLRIPNLVTSPNPLAGVRETEAFLKESQRKYPVVLKPVRGGSGAGLFVAQSPEDLELRMPLWLEQLRINLGEAILYAEKHVESGRRVSLPFARLRDSGTRIFPAIDGSLQSRNRKLIEFCPASAVDPNVIQMISSWTERLLDHVDYVGVGTLEYMVDGPEAFLLEGLPRLTASFPLWERVAGERAVFWQVAAAQGGAQILGKGPQSLPDTAKGLPPGSQAVSSVRPWASGLSMRLHAEDSLLQLPQPGKVKELSDRREWKLPKAEGQLWLGIDAGEEVTPEGESLLGLLTVVAQDRTQVMTVAQGILDELWIAGSLQTNERFLGELIAHPWVREGVFHAGFVDEEFVPEVRPSPELLSIIGSVVASVAQPLVPEGEARRWAVGDQWVKPEPEQLSWIDGPQVFDHAGMPGVSGRLQLPEGRRGRVCAYPVAANRWQVRIGPWVMSVKSFAASAKTKRKEAGPRQMRLFALVAGRVHAILFRENTPVPAHEPLLVLESLKSLVPHALPRDARVVRWNVAAEEKVQAGQELGLLEID